MSMQPKTRNILLIIGTLITVILAVAVVMISLKLKQAGTKPVVPTVPASKPKADTQASCMTTFTVGAARPDICSSSTISSTTTAGVTRYTVTMTATVAPTTFSLAFYNLDNLYGPGNPKPLQLVAGTQYTMTAAGDGTAKSHVFTIDTTTFLGKTDQNPDNTSTDKTIRNIQVNGYFVDANGNTSNNSPDCVQAFTITQTTASHFECSNNACRKVSGAGTNTCNTDNDCVAASPTPSPSPSVSPSPTPSPTPSPSVAPNTAGFILEKYEDTNGNASRDSSEKGLSWNFTWDLNGDANWRDYVAYAEKNGQGGTVGGLKDGDKIRAREADKAGWNATTATEVSFTLKNNEVYVARFGNRPKVVAGCNNSCSTSNDCASGLTCSGGVCRNASCTNKTNCTCDVAVAAATATPAPQKTLPKAGSTAQTTLMVVGGTIVTILGILGFFAL